MKNLIALGVGLLLSFSAAAQQPANEAVMQEWATATVSQLICVVHYERLGDQEKSQTYAGAPLAHGASHGIPAQYVATVVFNILPQIREQWDQLPAEQHEQIPVMCDKSYVGIKQLVDSYIAWLEEQEQATEEPIMVPKEEAI
jgi:hypothetical protein